jgi:hypothetical protein
MFKAVKQKGPGEVSQGFIPEVFFFIPKGLRKNIYPKKKNAAHSNTVGCGNNH